MAFYTPGEIAEITVEKGSRKAEMPVRSTLILGFAAGAYIALGYLLYIRVVAAFPQEWSGVAVLVGASLFPIGLILTLIAGGELLTGNMMSVALTWQTGRISKQQLTANWLLVTIGNFMGALSIAYFFGHVVGLTEAEPYLSKMVSIAEHKLDVSFMQAYLSGIGCNWLVALAVWLSYGAKNEGSKLFVIWLPTMAFVAIGFQHVVANMFVIPAAIFAGHFNWLDYLRNFVPVFLGNATGGAIIVAWAYSKVYSKPVVLKP